MAGLINELMDVLTDMSGHIAELCVLSREKKEVIIKNDTDALKAITGTENTVVGKYQKTEKRTQALLADIAAVLGREAGGFTLSRLGEMIKPQNDYPAYMEIYRGFEKGLHELKALNDQNGVLLTNALDYIDYSMNVIRSSFGADGDIMLDTRN
ncbi:MAG: flagellar protein FlgN [Clostridiales bacterium]|jgi:flagellar biosynthesis/type III secretory pathway chaperone|nr:flagellar protein FlgN [Clostridiales bacterium]